MTTTLLLLGGFVLLILGGEFLVRGAARSATILGLSPLLIGLTLVGFGTSTPELFTSVQAALRGSPGIAVGNVVGSNICNILLILGVAALIRPVAAAASSFRRDGAVVALVTLACLGVLLSGQIGRWTGAACVALLLGYIVMAYRSDRRSPAATEPVAEAQGTMSLGAALLIAAGGLALVVVGAHLLVTGAMALASGLGVSDTLIGLTIVAVGTSLPELITSVMAAIRRQDEIAFGNVLGSNIYNILGILGVTALVEPIAVPPEIMQVDGWVMLAATAALILFAITGQRINRAEGGVLLTGYAAYLAWLVAG
ncbi:calcium/sodium antiporter [Aquicoccus sp. SCR17]|nr:calcium/sodium antiporter [Carideicomes alvinocaridis]